MKKAFKKLQTILYCISIIEWKKFFSLYDKNAKHIIWFYPFYREHFWTQSVEREFGLINALINQNLSFRLYFKKDIGKFYNKTIFYMATSHYDEYKFSNYTSALHHISKQLEQQGNKVYPTSHETLFWENKVHMHKEFQKHCINEPQTYFLTPQNIEEIIQILSFPVLLKEPHSCSSLGIYKVSNKEELKNVINEKSLFKQNEAILVQQLVNMRKDMRVTIIGEEICLHYWRINPSKEWKPTATGYGSDVDFVTFPEKWRQLILDEYKKLKLTSAGIDITFENDNLDSPPIFLEVSPFYQPNPKVLPGEINCSYGEYKKQFRLKNSWDTRFVDIVFELEEKLVKYFLGL
jgi:hypothetical protein